ncbi:surface layer protein, putative, partial [Rhizoctonia solani AG-3 Rhs1AP]
MSATTTTTLAPLTSCAIESHFDELGVNHAAILQDFVARRGGIEQSETNVSSIFPKIASLENHIPSNTEKLSQTSGNVSDLSKKFDESLEDTLDGFSTRVDELSTKFDELSTKFDELSTKFDELSTKVNDKLDELSTQFDDLSTKLGDEFGNLSIKVDNLSIKVDNLSTTINDLSVAFMLSAKEASNTSKKFEMIIEMISARS